MTGQAESSGMRDSLSINKEHVGLLSDLFRDLYEQGAFSEPEKTRNILVRHSVHDRPGPSNLLVHRVPPARTDNRTPPPARPPPPTPLPPPPAPPPPPPPP